MTGQTQLLSSFGVDHTTKKEISIDQWSCYKFNHNKPTNEIPIILIENGPKNIAEVKKALKKIDYCVVLFTKRNILFLKTSTSSHIIVMESNEEYHRVALIIKSCNMTEAKSNLKMQMSIHKAIEAIPNATENFDNRGVFSTHYLRNRIFGDVDQNLDTNKIKIGAPTKNILKELGWDISNINNTYYSDKVSIIITKQSDFNIRKDDDDVAPSYSAVSKLKKSEWVILTNGTKWRLYTNKISASSTNYFEITLDPKHDSITQYLIIIFGAASFQKIDKKKTNIDHFFDEGKNYAAALEENLSKRIMSPDGLFLDLVKGVLNHDMKTYFSDEELKHAKQNSLKIMYRIWFLAYAESRNLLPVKDKKYNPISLQTIRANLDSYESKSDEDDCWNKLVELFNCVKNGSVKHNLPEYNGDLFKYTPSIDKITIKNEFIVKALYGLLERDGETIDYASLSVRHLGSVFESLMEFSVKQADRDIMLIDDKSGVREVTSKQESTYSYKKNELYLASKGGIALRKSTASFYTPDKIVEFLVNQGLNPILDERKKLIKGDLERYNENKSKENLQTCMDRLLDIQVLDPAMGSGHFLVEVLNRITSWVTEMLETHPNHPLIKDIESDKKIIVSNHSKKNISIDENLLTHDVLLKRKIMKRCIFGVDLNPMAVELARLSLWLDSFAIGVPLTYLDHHIKTGDSTIGMFLDDLKNKDSHSLDDWTPSDESNKTISDVVNSSDITVKQVHESEKQYQKHVKSLEPTRQILDALAASKINPKILPKKHQNDFIHGFGRPIKNKSDDLKDKRDIVNNLAEKYRFFHWELEMMDAFTDKRRGFDLIVGNPPWEKIKPNDIEFFTPHDVGFKSLNTNIKKNKRKQELFENKDVEKSYTEYKKSYKEKSLFYNTYEMQGLGHRDLWQLILERITKLVSKNGNISILIPQPILVNTGSKSMRKYMLEKNILQLYVFENRKKIFPIDSRYRFILLTLANSTGTDNFPVGFYLHNLDSLLDNNIEAEKFHTMSKQLVYQMSPDEYTIPELNSKGLDVFAKISQQNRLDFGLGNGWNYKLTGGFNKTNNAKLLLEDGKGWPVFEGKNIHQYTTKWKKPNFTINKKEGLECESKKKVFSNKHVDFFDSFRIVFRDITGPTDMRTSIATIIPPQVFHTHTLRSMVLTHNSKIKLDASYNKKISYLCGLLNSMTFDFAARAKTRLDLATIINSLPNPTPIHEDDIAELAGKLIVGSSEFEGFADSLHIENISLSPGQRIEITAKLDALVAHSYNLTLNEYKIIIDSFNLFEKNDTLYDAQEIVWNSKYLKEFYGEVGALALKYYKEILEKKGQ